MGSSSKPPASDKQASVRSDTVSLNAFAPDARAARRLLSVAVVEDAENIRQRLVQLVEEVGCMQVVGEADTEEKAIDICCLKLPDAIILDMQLAKGSGLGVLKTMGYCKSKLRPAIIVLTNFPSPVVERAARALGAEWFLDKSREFDKLPLLLRIISARQA